MKRTRWSLGIFILSLILLTACEAAVPKGYKPSEDWSRSLQLGEDVIGSIGIWSAGDGERVHVVSPTRINLREQFRYTQINADGEIIQAHDFNFAGQLRTPRLLPSNEGRIHFIWANRLTQEKNWILKHILINENGKVIDKAVDISPEEMDVGKFVVASDYDEGVIIVWERSSKDEIYITRLNSAGKVIQGPELITEQGVWPAMYTTTSGLIHIVWYDDRSFYYKQVSIEDFRASPEIEVVNLSEGGTLGGIGDTISGPVLGAADGWVYILWSILSISDVETGTAVAEYASFPESSPAISMPERILMLYTEEKPYMPYEGAFELTQFSPSITFRDAVEEFGEQIDRDSDLAGQFMDMRAISNYVMNPSTAASKDDELAFAVTASHYYRGDTNQEISVILFKDGHYKGYSFASLTGYLSDDPVIALDEAGNLHLAWREGANGNMLYYATSSPVAMASLDSIGVGDFFNALLAGSVEGFAGIAFLPFIGFGWILPGMLLIVVWSVNKDWESIQSPSSWLVLALALLTYYLLKLIFLPTITSYVPFSAWIPIPQKYEVLLRLGIPTLIVVISVLVAIFVSRRSSRSTLVFYLSWTITDAVLTLLIYGVNLLGVV